MFHRYILPPCSRWGNTKFGVPECYTGAIHRIEMFQSTNAPSFYSEPALNVIYKAPYGGRPCSATGSN
jgi:hypothetical protein